MAKPLISDELWEIIELLLAVKNRRFRHPGRKPIDNRKALSASAGLSLSMSASPRCSWPSSKSSA